MTPAAQIPGPEGACRALTDRLTDALPVHLDELAARLGVELPHPVKVVGHDTGPLGIDDWPAVIVQPVATDGMTHVDVEGPTAGDTYRIAYTLDVLCWVRSRDGYDATALLSYRYAAALRACLLHRTRLQPWDGPDRDAPPPAAVDPTSLREDYSPVSVDPAGRTIAATSTRLRVHRMEHIAGPDPRGTVRDVRVDGRVVGPDRPVHPALAE